MIHFFTNNSWPLDNFIDSWAGELKPQVQLIRYGGIPFRAPLNGSCIFTDLERLGALDSFRAKRIGRRLQADGHARCVLNDPARYVRRFDLLQTLHHRGINAFRVFRVGEVNGQVNFPVFLRNETDHDGALTGLLHSPEEMRRAVSALPWKYLLRKKRLMVVEYCDCADADGLFRKYSVMNIRGRLIPRHVLFSRNWVTKTPDLVSDSTVEEELRFIEEFPHRAQIAEIFRLSGVDYGRIDYGIKDGRVQVWEINTNPVLVPRREKVNSKRFPSQSRSAQLITETLLALASGAVESGVPA